MKIILINYRFFISGGPERYMFNIMQLLESRGHEVIPFSVKHNKNADTKYEDYFLDAVGSGDEIYGYEYKKDLNTINKVLSRLIYSFEAKRKLKLLINEKKPDLVYVLQYRNKMSCSVIDAAYEMGVPVVQRISDFGHMCITNIFYQYEKKEICEKCLCGSKWNGLINNCAGSYASSFIKVLALSVQDILKIREKISAFVIPARFTVEKFVEFGVPREKIYNIPTFFNPQSIADNISYGDYFLYVGRVDVDKGLFTLVKAFINTPYKLIIAGSSIEGYDDFLKDFLKDKSHNITFAGQLTFSQIKPLLESCLCTICPSEWYDNFPNAVLESYAFKKAVIASDIGSLKDLVVNNETGVHFTPADIEQLRLRIKALFENPEKAKLMGENAYKKLINDYSAEVHYKSLLDVFEKTIKKVKD